MIIARVTKKNSEYFSFSCEGHSGYSEAGTDIICSAVSILVINTINSIEKFTNNEFIAGNEGKYYWEFIKSPDSGAILLMDSLVLGLTQIEKNYGNNYLRLIIEEV